MASPDKTPLCPECGRNASQLERILDAREAEIARLRRVASAAQIVMDAYDRSDYEGRFLAYPELREALRRTYVPAEHRHPEGEEVG